MKNGLYILILTLLFVSCSKQAKIPENFSDSTEALIIYPDYANVVVPSNIAPLDFQVKNDCDEVVVCVEDLKGNKIITQSADDNKIIFDEEEWHKLLKANQGKQLQVTVYGCKNDSWVKYMSFGILVAEPIDKYLTYRLLDPSYDFYYQMGIYQRDLENFNEATIYENNRKFDVDENHCMNCHNFQNHSTKHMLFHVRGAHAGTMFINDGKIEKRMLRSDSILANAVYPSWHPTKPWLAFSSNITLQYFHMEGLPKVDVFDEQSDLIFYDAEKKELRNVLKTTADLETFPCWDPKGDKLYYCKAHVAGLDSIDGKNGKTTSQVIRDNLMNIRYDIMSIPFDIKTQSFGTPQVEVPCVEMGKSASIPRMSPDGKYLLFSMADHGQFHIWQNDADLYVKNMQTGEVYPLLGANSKNVDSYHGWSSNGRWIAFSSRREDGIYTRVYIAYFDKHGRAHKAFLLPQKDPEHNLLRQKSYNVPELSIDKISVSASELSKAVRKDIEPAK